VTGRGLLLLHGFTGSPLSFRRAFDGEALVPALSGHDGSPGCPSVHGFLDEVDRIAGLARGAGGGRLHVAGYSLGARVALGLLVRHPELFSGATLIGVHPGLETATERAERVAGDEQWCRLLEGEGLPRFVRAWQDQPLFASQARLSPELLAEQEAQRLRHDARGLAHALRCLGLGQMPNFRPALPALELPVKLLVGSLDVKFVGLAHALSERLPRAAVVEVADAGHNLLLERPDAVRQALEEVSPA
jgi:2-succinyl-6-hydroxy-2,4-cyclohexadiene-1-carboxylate synthase